MRSSERRPRAGLAIALVALCASAQSPAAEPPASGFALERFYPSAPGAGWFAMDALDMPEGVGGVLALTLGYARNPLHVPAPPGRLAIVSSQASAEVGVAASYDRYRFSLAFDFPVALYGQSGSAGGYAFGAPDIDFGSHPDMLSDARLGFDVRLYGSSASAFRLGVGAQLFLPNGNRDDYQTDDTLRGMLRVLFAGDAGRFAWAGHVGLHIRPRSDGPAPATARGSELLFGVAGGAKLALGKSGRWSALFGLEVYGATALGAFFGEETTALEGLVVARVEGPVADGVGLRIKLGGGAGLHANFGAPEWRALLSLELFGASPASSARP